jgi:hypothetical protein
MTWQDSFVHSPRVRTPFYHEHFRFNLLRSKPFKPVLSTFLPLSDFACSDRKPPLVAANQTCIVDCRTMSSAKLVKPNRR